MCTDGHHGVSYGQTVTDVQQLTNDRVQMGPDIPLNHTPQIREVCDICDFVSRFVSFVFDIPKNLNNQVKKYHKHLKSIVSKVINRSAYSMKVVLFPF